MSFSGPVIVAAAFDMLGLSVAIGWVLGAPVDLRWTAPSECPSEHDVRARTGRYLRDAADGDTTVVVEAEVVEQGPSGWLLTLTTTDGEGDVQTRSVVDADCDGLAETTAVLTALAVSPDASVELPPEPEPPEPELPPEPEPELPPEPEPQPIDPEQPGPSPPALRADAPRAPDRRRSPASAWRSGLRIAGGGSWGWLPIGGEVGVAVTLGRRGWAAELEALVGVPRGVRLPRSPGAGANLLAWSVVGRGCGVVPLNPWLALPLCGGVEAGQVRATSVGLDNAVDAALPWVAAVASVSLRADVHPRVSIWVMPELQLGALRPRFHATADRDQVFAASLVSGRVRAGIEFVF